MGKLLDEFFTAHKADFGRDDLLLLHRILIGVFCIKFLAWL